MTRLRDGARKHPMYLVVGIGDVQSAGFLKWLITW
jgi:hypothetical protein